MTNIAIFASGSGTNAENIARTFMAGSRVRVVVALTNNRDAGVIARMEALNIPVLYFPNKTWSGEPGKILDILKQYDIDIIALAGFMRCVSSEILQAYPGRVINIHPSLLPRHGGKGMYGHHVHEAVIASGDKESGVTVHYVTEEIDGGEIILQKSFPLNEGETASSLEARIHPLEYEIYPQAIVKVISALRAKKESCCPPQPSPDEEWADALSINYSDEAAADRAAQLEERRLEAEVKSASAEAAAHVAPSAAESVRSFARSPQSGRTAPPALAAAPSAVAQEKEPKSYLWVAVVMLIFFNTLLAVVAIVYACQVSSKWCQGDRDGALRASNRAQGWCIASFVVGLLTATLWVPLTVLSNLLF